MTECLAGEAGGAGEMNLPIGIVTLYGHVTPSPSTLAVHPDEGMNNCEAAKMVSVVMRPSKIDPS